MLTAFYELLPSLSLVSSKAVRFTLLWGKRKKSEDGSVLINAWAQDVSGNNVFFQIPTMVSVRPAARPCGGLSIAWPRFLSWLAIVLLHDLSPSSLPIALIAVALKSWERHLTSLRFSCDLCERNCSTASRKKCSGSWEWAAFAC